MTLYEDSTSLQKVGLERAVKRLKTKIENVQTIYANEITIMVLFIILHNLILYLICSALQCLKKLKESARLHQWF